MSMPGAIGNVVPPGLDALVRRIQTLEGQVALLQGARRLESASVGAGGLRSADFDGTLDPATAGTQGWGLSGSNGNAIFNDIVLRGGIIGNDALAHPLTADARFATVSGYSLAPHDPNSSLADVRLSVTFTVPAGFTSAALQVAASDGAANSTASIDNLWSYVEVAGVGGFAHFAYSPDAPAGRYTASQVTTSGVIAGLSGGGTITVNSRPSSNTAAWAANAGNWTSLTALCLFLR